MLFRSPEAINFLGDVVGVTTTVSGESHAAILALNSQPTVIDLGTLGGYGSEAYGINDLTEVVGSSSDAYGCVHAFLVTPETDQAGNPVWYRDEDPADGINDLMIDLDPLTGLYPDTYSSAVAINNLGQVVGWATGWNENSEIVLDIAVLWQLGADGNVSAVELPGLNGSSSVDAYDINDLGQVVGRAYTSDGQYHAVLWEVDADGNVSAPVDLGYLAPEHEYSEATGINELGEVVGVSRTSDRKWHAFLVTPVTDAAGNWVWYSDGDGDGINDLMIDLGLPDKSSGADGVNDSAQVVGWADFGRKPKTGAFLWENGVMTPLNELIPSEPKWSLWSAYSINEAGQIVGGGVAGREKESHGYLLTPTP